MVTVCSKNKCVGCGACKNICPMNAINLVDSGKNYNAYIDSSLCVKCHACKKVCQKIELPKRQYPRVWKQGWTNKVDRGYAASGGAVTSLVKGFIRNDGIAYLCHFENGSFMYNIVTNEYQVKDYVGSKYVKSDIGWIYKEIKNKLKENKKVLFVGLPCQVAGLIKYLNVEEQKNFYSIDLICHGTPSKMMLDMYLQEIGYNLEDVKSIKFREGTDFNLFINGKKKMHHGERDRYSIAFLNGLIYTDNCYECDFASSMRIADITVGDSWGSKLSQEEKHKGISLLLVQSDKGEQILSFSDMELYEVNVDEAVASNHQLKAPTKDVFMRRLFFKLVSVLTFSRAVFICFPIPYIKQRIRKIFRL